jgi:hypothetical protein
MSESKTPKLSRRRLFAGAGTAGALAAAAVTLPLVRPAEPVVGAAKRAPDKGGGYQVTQHVLDYYRTTRV